METAAMIQMVESSCAEFSLTSTEFPAWDFGMALSEEFSPYQLITP
jgi:hypothetical protein